jgi:peptidoglycan/LPS O-acetylase OafA/YrhL
MGLLRLTLAIIVVLVHAGKSIGIGGAYSVEFFFAISGYVIALTLEKKTEYSNYVPFIKSRFLRIAPAYYFVCILLTLSAFTRFNLLHDVVKLFAIVPTTVDVQLFIANIFVVTQDVVMFTGFVNGKHVLVSNFWSHHPLLFHGLLIPQAWSLSLEIYFYLIAPWVIRSRSMLALMLVGSFLLKASGYVFGFFAEDPWNYRFFPSELCMFLFGCVAYQYLQKWRISNSSVAHVSSVVFSAIVLFSHRLQVRDFPNGIVLFCILIALLPTLASIQKSSILDSFCATLSYPIYIVHLAVIELVDKLLELNYLPVSPNGRTILIVLLAILAGYAIHHLVEKPVSSFVKHRWKTPV